MALRFLSRLLLVIKQQMTDYYLKAVNRKKHQISPVRAIEDMIFNCSSEIASFEQGGNPIKEM